MRRQVSEQKRAAHQCAETCSPRNEAKMGQLGHGNVCKISWLMGIRIYSKTCHIERTAATVKQWKAMVTCANGSRLRDPLQSAQRRRPELMFYCVIPASREGPVWVRSSSHFRVVDNTRSGKKCSVLRGPVGREWRKLYLSISGRGNILIGLIRYSSFS